MKGLTKVLIVDDENHNIHIMQEILRAYPQYHYQISMSGEDALEHVGSFNPDIILLDVVMPGIDGYEVCRKIRQTEKQKIPKIIMFSSKATISDRLRGYRSGADDYIAKPFFEDELLAKLTVFSQLNRMEEVDNLKTTALNLISHETRTPINSIIMASELLLELDGLVDNAVNYGEIIKIAGLRIKETVNKMKRYSTIKDGFDLQLSKQSLSQTLGTIVGEMSNEYNVQLYTDFEEGLEMEGDWTLLAEAFSYVLKNAIEVTPKSGDIKIVTSYSNNRYFVKISDQGPGIEEHLGERIFDGLYSTNIMQHSEGTGVSLAIAWAIINEHNGELNWKNKEKGGVEFEFRFNGN